MTVYEYRDWRSCCHIFQTMPTSAYERCVLCGLTSRYSGWLWWRRVVEIRDGRSNVLWKA